MDHPMEMPRLSTRVDVVDGFFQSCMLACTPCVMMYGKRCKMLPGALSADHSNEVLRGIRAYCRPLQRRRLPFH